MTDFEPGSPYLEGLRRLKLPRNEDSAVRVVIRYFSDRSIVCTEDEARIVLQHINGTGPAVNHV